MNLLFENMKPEHFPGVVELQRLAFPPPFDESLLWNADHLAKHHELFPDGQFVGLYEGRVVASCSNTLISEEKFQAHASWDETVGGYFLATFDPNGSTLYGLDISVHPDFRRQKIGNSLYWCRKNLVVKMNLNRYATACRIPDFRVSGLSNPRHYCDEVRQGLRQDRTLSPLLRYDLILADVLTNYMDDPESGNAAALLEWTP